MPKITRTPSPDSKNRSFDISLEKYRLNSKINFPKEVIFLITHADLAYDKINKTIVITNENELHKLYEKRYSLTCDGLQRDYKNLKVIIASALSQLEIDLSKLDEIKIHKAANPRPHSLELEKLYLAYSHYRTGFAMTQDKFKMTDRLKTSIKHLLIDEVMQKIFEVVGACEQYQTIPPKISKAPYFAGYLRDEVMVVAGELYHSPIHENYHLEIKNRRILSAKADLMAVGLEAQILPFVTEGGNIIIGKTPAGENLMLIAVSETAFDGEKNKFIGATFCNKEFKDYKKFCQCIEQWGVEMGYKTVVIDRNPKYKVMDLYHLDTFLCIAGDILLLPKESLITEESREDLTKIFGENIILMNEYDRKNLASNFITVSNHIIFSSPDISSDVIGQFCERGFNCVIPPMQLSLHSNDGLRCHTQEIPSTTPSKVNGSNVFKPIVVIPRL